MAVIVALTRGKERKRAFPSCLLCCVSPDSVSTKANNNCWCHNLPLMLWIYPHQKEEGERWRKREKLMLCARTCERKFILQLQHQQNHIIQGIHSALCECAKEGRGEGPDVCDIPSSAFHARERGGGGRCVALVQSVSGLLLQKRLKNEKDSWRGKGVKVAQTVRGGGDTDGK